MTINPGDRVWYAREDCAATILHVTHVKIKDEIKDVVMLECDDGRKFSTAAENCTARPDELTAAGDGE